MQRKDTGKKACVLLEKKIILFTRYLSVTQRIKQALGNNEDGKLRNLLAGRQDLIHKIEKIDLAIKGAIPTTHAGFHLISNKFKGLIDNYLKQLRGIMEMVEPLDRELILAVQQEYENTKTDLLRRQKSRQAVKGYGNFRTNSAKFLDTRR